MSLAEWSGTEQVEYAIRYQSPAEYAGVVGHVTPNLDMAKSIQSAEHRHPQGKFVCDIVERTVTYGPWREVAA